MVSRVCGCALFDWIAEQGAGGDGALWSAEQRRPTATAAIVAIFSQFAKDLGGTSVVRVRFDQPAAAPSLSDSASVASSSGQSASTSAAVLAAGKRSTRTFPRYGQTIHSRGLLSGPAGVAGRRPTTVNGSSPGADDDGRGSLTTVANAYNSSPFGPAGTAQQQPNSPTSPPFTAAAPSTHLSALADAGAAVRFDMYCADNDAILIAAFVTPSQQQHSGAMTTAPSFASHADVEAACVKLRDAFQARFNNTLQQMHNTFMTMARNTDEVRTAQHSQHAAVGRTHALLLTTHCTPSYIAVPGGAAVCCRFSRW